MSALLKKEKTFLRLLLHVDIKQQKALLNTIQSSQLQAIVQIVYNVLMGMRDLTTKDKNRMKRYKNIIRRFVSKALSFKERKRLLYKYFKHIKPALTLILKEL